MLLLHSLVLKLYRFWANGVKPKKLTKTVKGKRSQKIQKAVRRLKNQGNVNNIEAKWKIPRKQDIVKGAAY